VDGTVIGFPIFSETITLGSHARHAVPTARTVGHGRLEGRVLLDRLHWIVRPRFALPMTHCSCSLGWGPEHSKRAAGGLSDGTCPTDPCYCQSLACGSAGSGGSLNVQEFL